MAYEKTFDYLSIGSTPAEETSEQLGPNYNAGKAKAECRRFIEAIRKVCGLEPSGAKLVIKSKPHDAGTYYEVNVKYDPSKQKAIEYAFKIDAGAPGTWEEAGVPEDWEDPNPQTDPPKFWTGKLPDEQMHERKYPSL